MSFIFHSRASIALTALTCLAISFVFAPSGQAQVNFVSFSGASYNSNEATMNATLGITGYTIENFSNVNLVPGLQVRFGGNMPDVTYSTLPQLFDTTNFPDASVGSTSFTNNYWDDKYALANGGAGTNLFASLYAEDTTFLFASGAQSVGVGLANFQSLNSPIAPITNHEILVNGILVGTLESLVSTNWTPGINVRNVYIRLDATGSSNINSIIFRNINAGQDGLVFDHLAFRASVTVTPEPSSLVLFFCMIMTSVGFLSHRLKNARKTALQEV